MNTQSLIKSRLERIDFKISKHIKSKDILKSLQKEDLRGDLFAIEGALRLHLKNDKFNREDKRIAESCLTKLKNLEDMLGAHGLKEELLEANPKTKLPLNLMGISKRTLKTFILKEWNSEKIIDLEQKLISLNWPKNSNKKIRKLIKHEIERIHNKSKILKDLILVDKFDYENLEQGFHEWRRAIRWISIYLQFYTKQIYLKPPIGKSKLDKKHDNDPFSKFKGSKKDIVIDKENYLRFSDFIFEIGEIKKKGEAQIFSGVPYHDLEKDASKIYIHFMNSKVIKKLLI